MSTGAVSKEDLTAAAANTAAVSTVVEPAIAIKGATKRYGTRTPGATVLDGIDLTVAKKEFVSIIGPSGCGKSTLLKLVAGLNPITKGSIAIDGVSLTVNHVTSVKDGGFAFDVMLVPHTLGRTLLGNRALGVGVNIEVDVLARYVARQLAMGDPQRVPQTPPGSAGSYLERDERLLEKLKSGGWV